MFEKYYLNEGETIEEVAKKFNTSSKILEELNNLDGSNYLRQTEYLVVPQNSKKYFNYYVVEKGDSLYKIGRQYNINPELLAALNGLNMEDYIYPNEQILIPAPGYSYYITAEGDTIDEVVKVFNSNLDKFMDENETIYLMAGQLLVNKKQN